MADVNFGTPQKAASADMYLLTRSTFVEFPNLWVGPDLTSFRRDDLENMLASIVKPSAEIREGYDAHIAEIARAAGAPVVVTDNRRHFLSALRYDMRVETPAEFLAGLKTRRSP